VLVLHRASKYAEKTAPAAIGQEVPQNELLQARGFLPPGNIRYEGTYFVQADLCWCPPRHTTCRPAAAAAAAAAPL